MGEQRTTANFSPRPSHPPTHSVSVETARKWLHDMGFNLQMSKGVFVDGHERPDVVESRRSFSEK